MQLKETVSHLKFRSLETKRKMGSNKIQNFQLK